MIIAMLVPMDAPIIPYLGIRQVFMLTAIIRIIIFIHMDIVGLSPAVIMVVRIRYTVKNPNPMIRMLKGIAAGIYGVE